MSEPPFLAGARSALEATYTHFGADADWTLADGSATLSPVRAIKTSPTADFAFGGAQARAPKTEIRVRRAEVAQASRGDQVTIGSAAFQIIADPTADDFGLEWICEAAAIRAL